MLGVGVSLINMSIALDRIDRWIATHDRQYVSVCTVHTVMECRRNEKLRQIVNAAGMTTPDGMPLVWLSRLAGHRFVSRVYGPDLMLAEMEASTRTGHRHFFYGGRDTVAARLADVMRGRYPRVQVVGTYAPPVATAEELCSAEAAALINQAQPDIVWVGLGTPKQERWMRDHKDRLSAPVLVGVGAAFDFHAGTMRSAPAWMGDHGLEWLFRLAQEPRRLWRRYLLRGSEFAALAIIELLKQK